jgi:hypothetical protein
MFIGRVHQNVHQFTPTLHQFLQSDYANPYNLIYEPITLYKPIEKSVGFSIARGFLTRKLRAFSFAQKNFLKIFEKGVSFLSVNVLLLSVRVKRPPSSLKIELHIHQVRS